MTRTVASLIAGKPVDASATTLTVPNPADLDEVVAEAALADADTFLEACRVAKDAQRGWAATPAPVRGRAIQQFGRLVEDNFEALSALITREIGKPIAESRGEVQEVIDTCNFFLGEGRRLYGQTVPSEMPDKQLFTFRTPVGVAAIVTAGNFPVAVPSWYIVPALVCGNAVVWKPAEYTPATAEAFAQLLLHAGLPEGVFNLVLADGAQTFEGLERALDEGVLDKIGFTGSSDVGRRIGELAGRHLQNPCLELGGKNPSWSCPTPTWTWRSRARCSAGSAQPASAARRWAPRSCTSRSTTSSSHGSMPRPVAPRSVTRRSRALRTDDLPALRRPVRAVARADRAASHRCWAPRAPGGSPPSNPREGFVGDAEAGLFYHPTIVDGVTIEDAIYRTETFGPIVGVASFGDFDEAMALANGHGYGLSSSIYTRDPLARVPVPRARSRPAWSASTTPPAALRPTCPSAATARAATARGNPACGCSISSRSGSP